MFILLFFRLILWNKKLAQDKKLWGFWNRYLWLVYIQVFLEALILPFVQRSFTHFPIKYLIVTYVLPTFSKFSRNISWAIGRDTSWGFLGITFWYFHCRLYFRFNLFTFLMSYKLEKKSIWPQVWFLFLWLLFRLSSYITNLAEKDNFVISYIDVRMI